MVIEAIAGWDGWRDAAGQGGASGGDVRRDADSLVRSPRLLSTEQGLQGTSVPPPQLLYSIKREKSIQKNKKGETHNGHDVFCVTTCHFIFPENPYVPSV
jgi:hypothetical protein